MIVLKAPRTGDALPFTYDGRPFQRVGTTTSRMPQDRYESLLLERMHARRRWENQPAVGVRLEDLDQEEILRTRDAAIRHQRISAGTSTDVGDILDNKQEHMHAFAMVREAMAFLDRTLPLSGHFVEGRIEREDRLPVPPDAWRDARLLVRAVYGATARGRFAKDFGLRDQIQRAAVSVMSNIAEGFERGSNKEFVQFLYVAKGSAGEVRSQLYVASDVGYLQAPELEKAMAMAGKVSRRISAFINYPKRSGLQGEKKAATR